MPSPVLSSPIIQRPDRSQEIAAFLARVGWGRATRSHLAGDASFRRYERVFDDERHAVLMDAPPPFEDVRPFIHVTHLLGDAGLSAPSLIETDETEGFLLLEDLGDDSFSRVLRQSPADELQLYKTAMDALLHLQRHVLPRDIAPYDAAVYLREIALFSDWFMPQIVGLAAAGKLRADYLNIWQELLAKGALTQSVMVHRDYHADNLLWLPDRAGYARVGMIDYQDALYGDPFYDVVSLLEDARRDVAPDTLSAAFGHFLDGAGVDHEAATMRYAMLGAQRNLKIIGIFTRLSVRDGKSHYLSLLPRVWAHLARDLSHPALAPLAGFLEQHVPASDRGVIAVDPTLGSLS